MIPAPRSPAGDDPAQHALPAPRGVGDVTGLDATGLDVTGLYATGLDVAAMSIDELRHQRRLLTGELRGIRYWRRIAQAQTDLLVAGLLHHDRDDVDGLHRDDRYRDDRGRDGALQDSASQRGHDPGERLVRLRERSRLMGGHEHALRRDLDTVTAELAARLTDHAHLASPPTVG